MNRAKQRKATITIAAAACILLTALASFAVFGCRDLPLSKVVTGARVVLDALCEHIASPELHSARQHLDRGDLRSAIDSLEAELKKSHDPRVLALIDLLKTQLPIEAKPQPPPTPEVTP